MINTPKKTVCVTQISKQQEMIWDLILSSQGLSVFKDSQLSDIKLFLQKKALENQLPDLCIVDVMYFIQQEQSPYEFCRWCCLHYPQVEVILTHETANKVSNVERLWAIKQGAQDLLPGFQAIHLRAEIIFSLQRVLEVLDIVHIDQMELSFVLAKIQKIVCYWGTVEQVNIG